MRVWMLPMRFLMLCKLTVKSNPQIKKRTTAVTVTFNPHKKTRRKGILDCFYGLNMQFILQFWLIETVFFYALIPGPPESRKTFWGEEKQHSE